MDKKIIIGITAVATAGLIFGGAQYYSDRSSGERISEQEKIVQSSSEDKDKIEQLGWDEFQDVEKYSFCLAEAKIQTTYLDPILNNNGLIKHDSKEVLLFNKESQKIVVMAREIDYKYDGEINTQMGDINVKVPVTEHGSLSEVYAKNKMPVRIDYINSVIVVDPETKQTNWVYSDIGNESEMVGSRTGCAGVYNLDNAPGQDLLAGGDQIEIDRRCEENDLSGSYDGDFSFSCSAIDFRQAKELIDGIKIKEELQDTKNQEVFENQEDHSSDEPGSARGDLPNQNEEVEDEESKQPKSEDLQRALDELKNEMNASQKAEQDIY